MKEIEHPRTRISDTSYNHLILGYPLMELTGNISFTEALYLCLKGELPNEKELKMLDVLLTCGIDGGGIGNAQTQAARCIATANRDDPMAAIGGAMLAYGSATGSPGFTGQFVEDAYTIMKKENLSLVDTASTVVENARKQNKRIPGLGHRWYPTGDPRAIRIRECAEFYGFVGEKTLLYDAISIELSNKLGKPMPPNIDGAFAVTGLELGFTPLVLGPVFALGMMPGNIAQIIEEIVEHESRSIRRFIDERIQWQYTGPPTRHLLKEKMKLPLKKTKLEKSSS